MQLRFEWEIPGLELDEAFVQDLAAAAKLETAVRLFAERRISSGYAAGLLGISRIAFLDIVRERHVPLFEFREGELQNELDSLTAAVWLRNDTISLCPTALL